MNEALKQADWRKPRANTIPVWFWIVAGVIATCLVVGPIILFIYATKGLPVPPVHVGNVGFDRIIVDRNSVDGQQEVTISDAATIEEFRTFIDSLDSGWYEHPDTDSVLPWYISLMNESTRVARFGTDSSTIWFWTGPRRKLSDDEWNRLRSILALEQEPDADESIQDTPRE